MCIAIIYLPVFEVINLDINLRFIIKPFSYMNKKSGQRFQYLKNEMSF